MVVPHSAPLGSCFAPFGSSPYVCNFKHSLLCVFLLNNVCVLYYYCYATALLPSPSLSTPLPHLLPSATPICPTPPTLPPSLPPILPPQSYHKRSITASVCPTPAFQDLSLKKLAQPHLLVCAPSNAGVDEIVRRLLAEGLVVDTHQWRQQQAQQVEL